MSTQILIGTAGSGNQGTVVAWVGTAGSGNQEAIRAYIGTAGSGNQICYLHAPGTPASVTAVTGAGDPEDEIDLSWAHHATYDTATYWIIQRAPDVTGSPGTFATIESNWTSGTTYTNTGLDPDTTYWYRVAAGNYNGTSAYSASDDATTDPDVPNAPTGVGVTQDVGNEDSRLVVAWTDNSSDETGFKVYRHTADVFGSAVLKETTLANVVTWTDDLAEIEDGKTYYYWVVAYNANGNSPEDGDSQHTELSAVTDLAASNGSPSSSVIDLTWSNPSPNNADNVKVYYSTIGSPYSWSLFATIAGSATSDNVTGLNAGADYWFKVVRTNSTAGDSEDSNIPTEATLLAAPANLAATPDSTNGETEIDVSWDPVTDATGYKVYRDGGGTPIYTGASTSYADTGRTQNTTYGYTVRAYNATGDGELSGSENATTWPTNPQSFSGTHDGTYIDLTWSVGTRTGTSMELDVYNHTTASWDNITNPTAGTEAYNNHAYTSDHEDAGEVDYRIRFSGEATYATDNVVIPV